MDKSILGDEAVESGEETPLSSGHPGLMTIIGCVVILLVFATRRAWPGPDSYAEMAGYIFGQVLFVWGLAWLITIRKSSAAWHVGSLVAIFLVALAAALARHGAGQAALDHDTRGATNMMRQSLDSGAAVTAPTDAGPLTRMLAATMADAAADNEAFEREAREAGLVQVLSLQGLTPASSSLSHCNRLDRLVERAAYYGGRLPNHVAAGRRAGEEAVGNGEITPATIAEFERGANRSSSGYARIWTLNGQLAREAAATCRLLARSRWRNSGGTVMFFRPADAAAFNLQMARVRDVAAAGRRVQAENRTTAREKMSHLEG